ncbi:hypothetical protein Tco_1193871, partial [Tanacetum coccineum]
KNGAKGEKNVEDSPVFIGQEGGAEGYGTSPLHRGGGGETLGGGDVGGFNLAIPKVVQAISGQNIADTSYLHRVSFDNIIHHLQVDEMTCRDDEKMMDEMGKWRDLCPHVHFEVSRSLFKSNEVSQTRINNVINAIVDGEDLFHDGR